MIKFSAQFVLLAVIVAGIFGFVEYAKWREFNDGRMDIYFFDVGQGDSALVKFPNKKLVLIDTGPNNKKVLYGLSGVIPFWVNKIDMMILTHSHADHISGAIEVLQRYDVGCIAYRMDDNSTSDTELRLRSLIEEKHIPTGVNENCADGITDNFLLSDVLGASTDPMFKKSATKNQNFESITTLVTYYDFDVLFTGDAEDPVQQFLTKKINKDIEIIKVPHHGSKDSYYPPLLSSLHPELAIVSVGVGNPYGHPDKETIDGYKGLGINLLRTDENGAVHIRSDGHTWEILP